MPAKGGKTQAHGLGLPAHGGTSRELGEARQEGRAVPLPVDAERRRGARPGRRGRQVQGEGGPVEGERRAAGGEPAPVGRAEAGSGKSSRSSRTRCVGTARSCSSTGRRPGACDDLAAGDNDRAAKEEEPSFVWQFEPDEEGLACPRTSTYLCRMTHSELV